MNIYFSGIGGVGIGPLAEIAHDAGHTVTGSDASEGHVTRELQARGITVTIGQDGTFLEQQHAVRHFDWFVYTAALPEDHPELVKARELGIRTGKRDEFLSEFIKAHNLTMIAIAGTHGKTSTTGMAVWALKQLGVPVSYSVGSTLTFGPSGAYDPSSTYFVYECDEFDRNFLHFNPAFSLITSLDYDHPDTYPTQAEYTAAFRQYISQSGQTFMWDTDAAYIQASGLAGVEILPASAVLSKESLPLPGEHARRNGTLVYTLLQELGLCTAKEAIAHLSQFPGTDRRFELIAPRLYSDYGHHPKEIAATLQLAKELSSHVTLIYQPHQNVRQHEIKDLYTDDVFKDADEIYWAPTYLTRENPDLPVLTPEELTQNIHRDGSLHFIQLDDTLKEHVKELQKTDTLILCMGAGTIDAWVRHINS